MFEPTTNESSLVTPFNALLRSHDLRLLWLIRILVNLRGVKCLFDSRHEDTRVRMLDHLRLTGTRLANEEDRLIFFQRLCHTLALMEKKRASYRFPRTLHDNLTMLCRHFGLTALECRLLALAVLLKSDELLIEAASCTRDSPDTPKQLSRVTKDPERRIAHAIMATSLLRSTGLIEVSNSGNLWRNIGLQRGGLRRLASIRLKSIEEMFQGYLRKCPASVLAAEDYIHMRDSLELICSLMSEAVNTCRTGVNVLVYGPPGTGKTQLARVVASLLNAPLYEVSLISEAGNPEDAGARLRKTATCQRLLGGRKALLVFDECDAAFDREKAGRNDTSADTIKAWVNNLLETNTVPTFWIANRIGSIDPAFIRRFDIVLCVGEPPAQHRLSQLERECGKEIPPAQLQRIANANGATPGVLARAINVMRRIQGVHQEPGDVLESLLNSTLRAQGHPSIRTTHHGGATPDYDVHLYNANVDLGQLANGLRKSNRGRILFYGPPGTGKTAFGYWLADTLGRPLALKRVSDIQSPLLGEMEKRLARAFGDAVRDNAILQIDEVDSFLQDRRDAHRSWEVTQVNEFLTQIESYDGIFIASTNLINSLDQAALRRFDYKVQVNYLRADQAWRLFERRMRNWALPMADIETCRQGLANLTNLTPGDFAFLERRHAVTPFQNPTAVMEALAEEATLKASGPRKIGFL